MNIASMLCSTISRIQSDPFTLSLLYWVLLEYFPVKLKVSDLQYPKSQTTYTVMFLCWFMLCALGNIHGLFFSL